MTQQPGGTPSAPRRPINENANPVEEMRKLHTEILQLDNQRFLLTTAAVVLFSTVAGWVTTIVLRSAPVFDASLAATDPASPAIDVSGLITTVFLPLASTALLWWVLLALFYFQLSKAATIRWLAAYLLLQGSRWEWTWHVFRKSLLPQGPKATWNWYLFREKTDPASRQHELPFYQIHRMTTQTFTTLMWCGLVYFLLLQVYMLAGAPLVARQARPGNEYWACAGVLLLCWGGLALLIYRSTLKVRQATEEILSTDEQVYMERWAQAEQQGQEQRKAWGGVAPGPGGTPS